MRLLGSLLAIGIYIFWGTAHAATKSCEQQYCVAVVDVGSTGSRLHIYSYDKTQQGTPINIIQRWSKKITPGFASLEPKQELVNAYLNSLFQDAPAYHIPTYYYATAGMRLVPPPKQTQYYEEVKNWFLNQSQWQLISAKTITGEEEGLFDWLAVNYQLGNFDTEKRTSPVGVMDIGGASVQIAIPVNEDQTSLHNKSININNQQYKIFIDSFLGLGQNEITRQVSEASACFPQDYPLPNGSKARGDALSCADYLTTLINNVHNVRNEVSPALQNAKVNEWYILGGMVDLVKDAPFNFQTQEFNNLALLTQANAKICQQDWSTLVGQYPNNSYLFAYCLFPSYYYSLIVDSYGISPQQSIHYLDKPTDWTIGAIYSF